MQQIKIFIVWVTLCLCVSERDWGYMLETTLLTCTDFSVKENDNPHTRIDDMKKCLVHGNILRIPNSHYLLNATIHYRNEAKNYELVKTKVANHDMENRRKVRSLQRDLVTLLMRLEYFSSAFNIPNFVRLTDGRRLMSIKIHVRHLKSTASFVDTVRPEMQLYISTLKNLTSMLPLLDTQESRRADANVKLEESVVKFRDDVRAQYDF